MLKHFAALLIAFLLLIAPALAQKKDRRIERLDLLEVRDLMHQMDTLKLQIAAADKRIKELEKETQERFKSLAEKYQLGKEDTINMESGEIVAKKEDPRNEK